MKKLIFTIMLVLGMATSGWATTYDLDLAIGNSGLLVGDLTGYTGSFGEVTIDAAGKVTFSGLQNVLYNGHYFDFYLTSVGLNMDGTFTTSPPSGYELRTQGSMNIDGFGNFNLVLDRTGSQGAHNSVMSVSFVLDPITASLVINNKEYLAAAHIVVFEGDIFGFAVTRNLDALTTGDAANSNPPSVPEPSTLLLLGGGLLGLSIFARRRMNK